MHAGIELVGARAPQGTVEVLTVLSARVPRRPLLLALMATFAAGNLLSAFATSYNGLIAARPSVGRP